MNIRNCYIYTRVSTAMQVDGYSLDAQMEALKEYARYRDLNIAGEYCDAGKSGKSIEGRPEFQKMMGDVMSNKDNIAFVLVFKLSRFGRNTADVLRSIQTLNDFGVDLVSVNESIDSSTHGGRLTLAILSAVAEMEKENITTQFMSGRLQRVKCGEWAGGSIPYGYRLVEHKLIPDEYEAEIVRKIFEFYNEETVNETAVAEALNKSSYVYKAKKSGEEKPFTQQFIARILSNPFYCGRLYFGRRTNKKGPDGKTIKYDSSNVVFVKGNHEALVSEDEWDKAEEKKKLYEDKRKHFVGVEYPHILRGLVKCPMCGSTLICSVSKSKNKKGEFRGKTISYYECPKNRKQRGRTCSFNQLLNEEIVDEVVIGILCGLKFSKEFKAALKKAMGVISQVKQTEKKLQRLDREYRDAEVSKCSISEQLDALNPLNDDYDSKYETLAVKLDEAYNHMDEIEKNLEETRKKLNMLKEKTLTFDNLSSFIDNLKPMLNRMTVEEKNELCCSFIERIDLFPEDRADGKIIRSISFKFPLLLKGTEFTKTPDADGGFSFTFDCSDIDIVLPEDRRIVMKKMENGDSKLVVNKPTYTAIQEYIQKQFGAKVSSLNIAQTKRKYGVGMFDTYHPKENQKRPTQACTADKEKLVFEALKYFNLIDRSTQFIGGR